MSKLAIFLFVAIFASTSVKAFDLSIVTASKETTDTIISLAIDLAKYELSGMMQLASQITGKLETSASRFTFTIADNMRNVLVKARKSIEDLANEAAQKQIDVTECTKQMVHLDELVNNVGTAMNLCVDQKLEFALDYVRNIITNLNDTIDHAVVLREDARHCFDNVNSMASLAKATFCAKQIGFLVTWNLTRAFPDHVYITTQLGVSLAPFGPSFAVCTTTSGLSTFFYGVLSTVHKTSTCIKDKMNEADVATTGLLTTGFTEVTTELNGEIITEEVTGAIHEEATKVTTADPMFTTELPTHDVTFTTKVPTEVVTDDVTFTTNLPTEEVTDDVAFTTKVPTEIVTDDVTFTTNLPAEVVTDDVRFITEGVPDDVSFTTKVPTEVVTEVTTATGLGVTA